MSALPCPEVELMFTVFGPVNRGITSFSLKFCLSKVKPWVDCERKLALTLENVYLRVLNLSLNIAILIIKRMEVNK